MRLTRSEQSARHAKRKLFAKSLKALAPANGWKCRDGMIFREHEGWFVSSSCGFWVVDYRVDAHFHIKPMQLDPIFWKIVGMDENKAMPLSFRALGAWTCRPPALEEREIADRDMTVDELAAEVIAWADERLTTADNWTNDRLVALTREKRGIPDGFIESEVCALILAGRLEEADAICREANTNGRGGGFPMSLPDGRLSNFVEMAIEWLNSRPQDQPLH